MTAIERDGPQIWNNEHYSRSAFMRRTARLIGPHADDLVTAMRDRRRVLGAFIAEEASHGRTICVQGSSWSQSHLVRAFSTLLETDGDGAAWQLPAAACVDGIADPRRYVMVTGGTKLAWLMTWLNARGLSLTTAGSHKGQSVAGLTATGSHGSTLAASGCESHVRGMVLAVGEERAVWLADPRRPVLREDFVAQFAESGDPAHFAAALVHVGGMGIVSALLLEVVPTYHVGLVRRVAPLASDWPALVAQGRFAEAIGPLAEGRHPHYYEITLDPFNGLARGGLETIWFALDPPAPAAGTAPLPGIVAATPLDRIASGASARLKELTLAEEESALPFEGLRNLLDVPDLVFDGFAEDDVTDQPDEPHRLIQLCAEWQPRRLFGIRVDVYNAAFAVPLERLDEALDIAFAMAEGRSGPRFSHDFVYTLRFARRSPARLGFLRFEHNAIINVDGLPKNFILGSDCHVAARRLQYLFDKAALPFSMHWGKDAQCSAAKIMADYGPGVAAYRAARRDLLGANASLFTSPALEEWGLA